MKKWTPTAEKTKAMARGKTLACVHCLKPLGDAPTNIEPWAHGPCAVEARLQMLGQRLANAFYRLQQLPDLRLLGDDARTRGKRSGEQKRAATECRRALDAYTRFRNSLPRRRVIPEILVPKTRRR